MAFQLIQEWEGYIVELNDEYLIAHLVDLTSGSRIESEEAEIPLAEISERDLANINIGSIFRWVIGYERSTEGAKKRVSSVVFRDLPRVTASDRQSGIDWAKNIAAAFKT